MKDVKRTATAVFMTATLMLSSCAGLRQQVVPIEKPIGQTDPETGLPLYYSSVDEDITPNILTQQGGTCWAYAAVTAIDYAYQYDTGMATGIDPVSLTNAIFDPDHEEGIILDEGIEPLNAGGNGATVMNFISSGYEGFYLTECIEYEDAEMIDIKNAILEYGAVSGNISAYETHFMETRGTTTFIADKYSGSDHEIVLVGWNDTFPRDAFHYEASQDGAWLAQNSYSERWGDGGFFWISYDTPFTQMQTYKVSTDYSEALDHCAFCASVWGPDDCIVANRYEESGTLSAVGVYSIEGDQDISVTVYTDDFESEYTTAEIHCDLPGYYTIPLDEPIAVNGFVVAVDYGDQIPCEGRTRDAGDRTYQFTSEEGQSFVLYQGEWIDVTDSVALRRLSTYDPINNFFIVALME